MIPLRPLSAGVCALVLAACSSMPVTRFHTLRADATPGTAGAVTRASQPPWEVSVAVPPQVDTTQWVVQRVDGTLAVLEHDRWISPLADEIRTALEDGLRAAPAAPARVAVDVRRLDAKLGRESRLDAAWTLAHPDGRKVRCEVMLAEPAPGGLVEMAAAHRAVVAALARRIGASAGGC
jgi:uncharacterized lipoprotein YmbA